MQRMALRSSLRPDRSGDFLAVDRSNADDRMVMVRTSEYLPIRRADDWAVCNCPRLCLPHIWISTLFLILGQTKQNLAISYFHLNWIIDRSGCGTWRIRQ